MSKLSSLMRESISAEKQSLEHKAIVSNDAHDIMKISKLDENLHQNWYGLQNFYEMYITIIRSNARLVALIQSEQVEIIQSTIKSSFQILNLLKSEIGISK